MDKVRVIHDTVGETLTVWWGDPKQEHESTMTPDEVIVMKDAAGTAIGFEALHYKRVNAAALTLDVETVAR